MPRLCAAQYFASRMSCAGYIPDVGNSCSTRCVRPKIWPDIEAYIFCRLGGRMWASVASERIA